jgi:formamidopyrimidine-DNA glycosylase
MPELPEVESLVRSLRTPLIGRSIKGAAVHWPRTLKVPKVADFIATLTGATIRGITRRGKYLLFELHKNGTAKNYIAVHLRMSGHLEIQKANTSRNKHHHVVLDIGRKEELRFYDPRKFGRWALGTDPEQIVGRLGKEPFDPSFSAEWLIQELKAHSRMIKPLLLDQTFIAGIGNIYADETLWEAGIHPTERANVIDAQRIKLLHRAIPKTLTSAIDARGTDFGDGVVPYGAYEPRIYGHDGNACPRCKTEIQKIVVAQRGTHFCPHCQRSSNRIRSASKLSTHRKSAGKI